ncbi:MAG: YicC family protein [Betaproteobacteria bacterium]|nr:YicC family protein [Betaproteobacteria bacterium]
MISSMTGYASRVAELSSASLSVELKSVNGRFLDLAFRLPEELRVLEPVLRERIATRAQRGKIECRMSIAPAAGAAPRLALNEPLLGALADASRRIQAAIEGAPALRVGEVLHWPGMLAEDAGAAEVMRDGVLNLFDATLADFGDSRAREGGKLKAVIAERVAAMRRVLDRIGPLMPAAIQAHKEKLAARLREVLAANDEDRIRQEMALYGVKVDVAEELSRLKLHLEEVSRVLEAGGAAGKRLDFLMQELNREANTLGSKSVSKDLSDASLELKLFIEQMREQVQNIE